MSSQKQYVALEWVVNIWIAIGFFMLIGPGLLLGNKVYPFVWGVPFFYFWNIIWYFSMIISLFVALNTIWKK